MQSKTKTIIKQHGSAKPPRWVPAAVKLRATWDFVGTDVPLGQSSITSFWFVCASYDDARRLLAMVAANNIPDRPLSDRENEEFDAICKRGQDWLDANQ
tara:strand:- start:1520 stop:1816 length:297 start_codon:yes stop_codon:yes gene_type:complete